MWQKHEHCNENIGYLLCSRALNLVKMSEYVVEQALEDLQLLLLVSIICELKKKEEEKNGRIYENNGERYSWRYR